MKKHIVFLRHPPAAIVWGGLEKLVCEWFQRIDYDRCRVTFVTGPGWKGIYQQAFQERGIPVTVLECDFDGSLGCLNKFFMVLRLLNGLNPDTCVFLQGRFFCFHLCHVLAAWFCCLGSVFMHENLEAPDPCPKTNKRYLGIFPSLSLWWHAEHWQTRMRAYFCQKIVAVSFGVKQKLVNLWHYPQEKIVVCHHGVDTGRFRRNPYTIGLKKGKERTVIAVSRLSKEKCVDRVIDAFDRLASLDDHLKLIILGSGPLEAQLQQLAAGKKHQARIKLIGHVQDTSDYLLKADYFVLSSDYEGLGISLLEAMSCGLICLSTRCAGPTEIIEEGINGLFIQKSAQGVQEGLEKALGLSGEQARSMGHRAMETVAGKFELNRNVRKVFDIFEVPYAENQRDRHHDTVILDSLYA